MTTIWTIAIDWDRDGSFTGQNDDVTSYTISANWFLGQRKPYQDMADDSMLTLVLNNSDRRFSPEYGSSPLSGKLTPFKPVRVQSNDGTTVRTHWTGWIESIQPKVNLYGERTVEITAAGPMQFCKATETALELQENLRTDQIIDALIKEVVIPPALVGAWVLGRTGNSELDQTTRLADVTQYCTLDQGITTLAMAADNWVQRGGSNDQPKDTFDVYRAIMDVVAAERGRFLYSRGGKALFWNRHRLIDDVPVSAQFNNTIQDLAYQYAGLDNFKNELVVVCHPRAIGATDQDILWQLDDKIIIPAGDSRDVTAKFQDGSDNRIGGKEVTVTDVQFEAGTADITPDVRANSATLKLNNTGAVDAVLKSCIVRGRKITDFGQMEAKAVDAGSIVDYGRRTLQMSLPSVDNYDDALSIAQFELHRRSQPRGAVSTLTLSSHGQQGGNQHAHQLARTLGDKITIQESQTGHGSSVDAGAANLLLNGDFAAGETGWTFSGGGIVHSVSGGKLHAYRNGGSNALVYQVITYPTHTGDLFTMSFKVANASAHDKTIWAYIQETGLAWFASQSYTIAAGASETTLTAALTAGGNAASLFVVLRILTDDNQADLTFDDVRLTVGTPYYIIGEAQKLTDGATLLMTTWYLEPAPVSYPWKLGDSKRSILGVTTMLAY